MKKTLIRLVILAAIVGAAWGSYRLMQQLPQRQQTVATAKVRQGDVIVRAFARGELRAVRSATLTAPNLFGTVQVTKLADVGSFAHEKDLVVEFDDAELLSRLEEKQLEIDQIEEQYKKSEADLAIRNNQDQVELLRARYSVRRAELEVKRNELLSTIDQKKNELNLEEAKRRLKQLESDIKSRQEQAEAELAVLRERRQKANLELMREKARLNQVKVLAPMSGLVAVKQNTSSRFGFGFDVPDIREGDQVQPGMPIADVLDLSELEVSARVGELDRANLTEGQEVNISLDAVPGKKFRGKIKSMSNTASANIMSSDPAKKFDVVFALDMKELLSGLGAKPEQIQKILATADANRKRPAISSASPVNMAAMQQSGGAPSGQGAPGAQGPFGGANAGGPPQMAVLQPPAGNNATPRRKRDPEAALKAGAASGAAEGQKGGRRGGGPGGGMPGMMASGNGRFTQQDIQNAKLPPPPEQDSSLSVLLRPGLLADVEITVEKIPNAVNMPAQALFENDGKPVAYVKNGAKFEARPVKVLKRTESTLIISSGLKAGDVVALADPNAKPGAKSGNGGGKGGAMNALPGGK